MATEAPPVSVEDAVDHGVEAVRTFLQMYPDKKEDLRMEVHARICAADDQWYDVISGGEDCDHAMLAAEDDELRKMEDVLA